MKLYTEEQVKELTIAAFTAGRNHNTDIFGVTFDKITPIELPSDKQIYDECKIGGMDTNQQLCFQLGAKWMRDKIQGGNK